MVILFLDGGGTKLQAIVYDNNKELEYASYGSCNLTLDLTNAKINIFTAIEYFKKKYKIDGILISAAGVLSCPELAKEIVDIVVDQYQTPAKIISDIEYHYYKYLLRNDGYVINLGTGTSALSFRDGKQKLYFGFGPNFDEPGCGHDIGKKLLAYLAYKEVNEPQNLLYNKYLNDFNCISIRHNVKALNHLSNSEIAAQAKWLLSLTEIPALMDDIKQIISASFSKLILWLSERQDQTIYFIGGVVNNYFIQSLLLIVNKQSHFNERSNYTMEEIWNTL